MNAHHKPKKSVPFKCFLENHFVLENWPELIKNNSLAMLAFHT